MVKEKLIRGSVERFQTENKRYGRYLLVNGIETMGQTGVAAREDRVSGCSHSGGPVKTQVLALPRECVFVEVHGQAGATGSGPPLRTAGQIKQRAESRDLDLQLGEHPGETGREKGGAAVRGGNGSARSPVPAELQCPGTGRWVAGVQGRAQNASLPPAP